MLELITRLLVSWRQRRWAAIWERNARQRAEKTRRRAAHETYERAHFQERLALGRELLATAPEFARSDQGQWACRTYGRWLIVSWLAIDRDGRLWFLGERHWFGALPDRPMDTPEVLAAACTTKTLRAALRLIQPRVFWFQALQEEILHYLGFRGRPI